MLENALSQFIDDGKYEYFIYSTADIIVPNNLFNNLEKIKFNEFCAFVYPNTHIINGKIKNTYWPHYGIDLIVLKYLEIKLFNFKEIIKSYDQYDWGIIENFYIAASEALKLRRKLIYLNIVM